MAGFVRPVRSSLATSRTEVHIVVVISHTGHQVRHLADVAREFYGALMLICRSSGLGDN
jgi:hypothetical protein